VSIKQNVLHHSRTWKCSFSLQEIEVVGQSSFCMTAGAMASLHNQGTGPASCTTETDKLCPEKPRDRDLNMLSRAFFQPRRPPWATRTCPISACLKPWRRCTISSALAPCLMPATFASGAHCVFLRASVTACDGGARTVEEATHKVRHGLLAVVVA
jgi:hypothetical protein